MPKRNPPETNLRRKEAPASAPSRGPGGLSLLLFWPFLLLNLVTRPFATPVKFLLRLAGYPVVAGIYGLLFLAIAYGVRAQKYDLAKIHEMPERSIVHDRLGEEIGLKGKGGEDADEEYENRISHATIFLSAERMWLLA